MLFFDFSGFFKATCGFREYHQSFGQLLSLHISINYQVKSN